MFVCLQHNDDPELWSELKRKEMEYEKRRNKRVQYYESVRHAQTVQIDDIPLPQMSEQPPSGTTTSSTSHQQQQTCLVQQPPNRIPLPTMVPTIELPPGIQLPFSVPSIPPPSLQKRLPDKMPTADDKRADGIKEPPGCPPGPPPDLHLMRELDSDHEDEENIRPQIKSSNKSKRYTNDSKNTDDKMGDENGGDVEVPKPTSVQQRILAIAGQKYDDFMKELENVHKNKERSKSAVKHDAERLTNDRNINDNDNRNSDNEDSGNNDDEADSADNDNDNDDDMTGRKDADRKDSDGSDIDESAKLPAELPNKLSAIEKEIINMPRPPPAPPMPMLKLPSGPPPPPMGMPPAMFGKFPYKSEISPSERANMSSSMMFRPPPRPGLQTLGIRMPPGMQRIRMPPGPPPGLPPSRLMHGHHKPPHAQNPIHNTLQAGPQLTKDSTKGMTIITAKPQIRNLSADVTRFVPSTLRVKREDKKAQKPKTFVPDYRTQPMETAAKGTAKGTTKDDAYMQFMREMQGLL